MDNFPKSKRELGLDYEPVLKDNSNYRYDPPVAEPVAYLCENAVGHKYFRWKKPSSEFKPIALYTTPPAAPVQEPEYWDVIDPAGNIVASETDAIRGWARIAGSYKPTVEGLLGFHDQGWRVVPKVAPPTAQPAPVQEPVAWAHKEGLEKINDFFVASIYARGGFDDAVPLYTTPPAAQRQWVGLTDEEILAANYPDGEENGPTISAPNFELDCFAKQVEAKLRSKNT